MTGPGSDLASARRIVVKVGSALLVNEATGDPHHAWLAAFAADALSPKATVKTVIAAADALLSYGQGAKAAELYQIALTKPGTADVNVLLNHLGIAQVYAGDYAGAQATLAKVDGKRKPLAQLWAIYAQSKAAGK